MTWPRFSERLVSGVRRRVRGTASAAALAASALVIGVLLPSAADAASVPPVPTAVTATATSSSTIHVTWADTSSTAQFVVSNGNVSTANLPAGTRSYNWGGLTPGTYMCFTVTAKNSSGQSAWSPYGCTTTTVPVPTQVTATVTSSTSIHVAWTDVSGGAAKFVVSNGNVSSADLAAGTTGYDWTGLTPGTYMCFTVTAKQGITQSPWSPYACTTIPIVPTAPGTVRVLALNQSTIHVSWGDLSDGAAQYEVSIGGTTTQVTAAGATSFDWGGLAAGTLYCFQVRAFNVSGISSWVPTSGSACVYTTAAGAVAPQPATGVTATATASYMIHLSWTDNNAGGSNYEISNGSASLFTASSTGATSFDWGGLTPGTTMCFTIRAVKFTGASSWAPSSSSPACATTPALTCQATEDTPDSSGYIDFYHGTSLAAAQSIRDNGIDLSVGDRYTDFGKGFYVTTDLTQAKAWANMYNPGQTPSVVHFRIAVTNLEPGGLCGAVFPLYGDTGYLATVLAMRTFEPPLGGAGYDFMEGPLLMNPFDYIMGNNAAQLSGQQDSFHTARGAAILDAGYVEILPAS